MTSLGGARIASRKDVASIACRSVGVSPEATFFSQMFKLHEQRFDCSLFDQGDDGVAPCIGAHDVSFFVRHDAGTPPTYMATRERAVAFVELEGSSRLDEDMPKLVAQKRVEALRRLTLPRRPL